MNNNKPSFIDGYKEMFASIRNRKLIIAMILVVLLISYIAFGGCNAPTKSGDSAGASGCAGCGSCSGCSDLGSAFKGDDPYAVGLHDYNGFDGMTISSTDVVWLGGTVRLTAFYPTELFTASSENDDLQYNGTQFVLSGSDVTIEVGCDRFTDAGNYTYGTEYIPQTFEEFYDFNATRILIDNSNACEWLYTPNRDSFVSYDRYYRAAKYYFAAGEADPEAYVTCIVIPKATEESENYGTGSAYNAGDALDMFWRDDVQAILSAVTITAADQPVPTADQVKFTRFCDGLVDKAGTTFTLPVSAADANSSLEYAENAVVENRSGKLEITYCAVQPMPEAFFEAYEQEGLITFGLQFTNNSDQPLRAADVFALTACNGGGASYDRARFTFDFYRTIQPGETINFTYDFFSYGLDNTVSLQVYTVDENDEPSEEYVHESDFNALSQD